MWACMFIYIYVHENEPVCADTASSNPASPKHQPFGRDRQL